MASEYASEVLAQIQIELSRADSKAATLLAAEGVVGGVGLASLIGSGFQPSWRLQSVFLMLSGGGLLVSIVLLSLAIYPRMRSGAPAGSGKRTYYFGDYAKAKNALEASALVPSSEAEDLAAMSESIWHTAKIAVAKHSLIRWGLWIAGAGLLFGLAVLFMK